MLHPIKLKFTLLTAILLALLAGIAYADEPGEIEFSGEVKKVIADKNKVAIKDPETKKRFTLIVEESTALNGFGAIGELNKKDKLSGKYIVTKDGKYIATVLSRE